MTLARRAARSLSLVLLRAICLASIGSFSAAEADEIALLPGSLALHGPEARQRLLVERVSGGQYRGQVDPAPQIVSSNPAVAEVVDGYVVPRANGQAVLNVSVDGQTAEAPVVVTGMDLPFRWSFRNHLESVLTKAGCNSGACHGAAAGKKGFKLSLRGYDPEGDFFYLTRQARGRRVTPHDPGRSLLVTKPTGAVPHGGGLRIEVGSRDYRVLTEWIAAGATPPEATDARLERLEILPAGVVLAPGAKEQLVVLAHFTDGHVEDVTDWAKFTSTNMTVAQVGENGLVEVLGHGEGAVTVWYLSQVVAATITAPVAGDVATAELAAAKRRNFIDELVLAKLTSLNIPPSPPCTDGEFLRRAMIDTIGVLPTADETKAFLADTAPDKRDRLIASLLERPEFVDYWTYKWCDLLLVNSERLKPAAMWAYHDWIRNQVAAGTPWDEFARQLVTAKGSTLENGATNFFVLHSDPAVLAETTSLTFLGTSIGCAKCHNHPLEKWTNNQYYAMANLFARVRTKDAPGDGNKVVFVATEGDLVQPLTGKPQPPQPLDGQPLDIAATADRRDHLAAWLTSPDNPYFSRSITNRVWANFFGVGLVENVDDLRLTNPASNEELLSAASTYLEENTFDLKALMRAILESETYQRSSQVLPANAADERFYSRYYPKRMMAEVLLDSISQVTGAPTAFTGYPTGYRALQLPDSVVSSYFLKTFGRPERIVTCECERSAEPSRVQVVHISNGDTINQKLETPGNRLDQLLTSGATPEAMLDELYLSALSRYPTPEERTQLLAVFNEAPEAERRLVLEDLYWSVLSSKEFLFNR